MAKTLTISIPDELNNKLQEVKGKMNISRICQEALAYQIEIEMMAKNEDLINFLRAGKMEESKMYKTMGKEAALDCIKEKLIPYSEMKAISNLYHTMAANNIEDYYRNLKYTIELEMSSCVWNEVIEPVIDSAQEKDPHVDADAFCCGFIVGVVDTWDELKDQL